MTGLAAFRGSAPFVGAVRVACFAIICTGVLGACANRVEPVVVQPREVRLAPVLAKTDFGQAVSSAVRTSPALSASGAEIAAAQATVLAARSEGRPTVQLGVDLATSLVAGSNFSNRSSPVLQVTQLLFDGGAIRRRIEAAEINVARQSYLRDSATATVALNAVEAWVLFVQTRKVAKLAMQNVEAHRTVLSQVQDSANAGVGTEVDTLSAQSALARVKARAAAAQNAQARAEARFIEVFGRGSKTSAFPPPAPDLPKKPLDELIAASPRLRSLNAEIDAAEKLLAAQVAARKPKISLDAGVGLDPSSGDVAVNAGISPRIKVSDGGNRNATIARAQAEVAQLRAERDALVREIQRALLVLKADRTRGKETVTALQAAVKATAATVSATRDQLATGRQNISQLLEAQRDQFEASEELEDARANLIITGYATLALTGDILDVFGLTERVAPGSSQ